MLILFEGKKHMKYIMVILTLILTLKAFSEETTLNRNEIVGKINVKVCNVKNDKGQVVVELYTKKKKFPTPEGVIRREKNSISQGMSEVTFEDVPFGTYAITINHDTNMNDRMDKNSFGLPSEGYGFSNNPRLIIGPPSFKKASFIVNQDSISLMIKMKY